MNKKWILLGVVVVAVAGTAAMMMQSGKKGLQEVQTAKVERREIIRKVNATGKIQPKTQVKISADVSAKIVRLDVVEGQVVEQGQFLLELDRKRYLAAVESAEASVRTAEANATLVLENLKKIEKDYRRSKELVANKLDSEANMDSLYAAKKVEKARHDAALSQVDQARASLKQFQDDLEKTSMYAPMSGTITDLNKEQGEIAIGSQFQEDVILVISDLSVMEAQVNVDENDIVGIAIGQDAEIEIDALSDLMLMGKVTEISNSANLSATGTANQKTEFEVTVTIIEPSVALRPGMTASADIITDVKSGVIGIPLQSVAVRTPDQLEAEEGAEAITETYTADKDGFVEMVFVLDGERVIAKQVETGIQSDDYIEIESGIGPQQQIVTGSYRAISRDLVNGQKVSVNNDPQRAAEE
jgi:HlyD family secretion protein